MDANSLISSLEKALDADAVERKKLLDQIAKLTAEVAKLNDYNQRHNKFTFGKNAGSGKVWKLL